MLLKVFLVFKLNILVLVDCPASIMNEISGESGERKRGTTKKDVVKQAREREREREYKEEMEKERA